MLFSTGQLMFASDHYSKCRGSATSSCWFCSTKSSSIAYLFSSLPPFWLNTAVSASFGWVWLHCHPLPKLLTCQPILCTPDLNLPPQSPGVFNGNVLARLKVFCFFFIKILEILVHIFCMNLIFLPACFRHGRLTSSVGPHESAKCSHLFLATASSA